MNKARGKRWAVIEHPHEGCWYATGAIEAAGGAQCVSIHICGPTRDTEADARRDKPRIREALTGALCHIQEHC